MVIMLAQLCQIAADEPRHESQTNDAALCSNRFGLLIGQVSLMVANKTKVGVGCEDRFTDNFHERPETPLR